ncbi:uncharacterized protein PHACADRAFT_152064 [Phanerochaete carnosa HHB-10118-sp]|uniref:Uncharacterized protein n=1 Tax=Phanerochaete carnosa (strain HHB-10118-sp) TaxID=650164 RepID=K5UNP3_PHACS|nr:uncharacterized protein PHACADRAFT_152064 [Phanerochaete carnosa HHB-10118-sp]EKM51361.1 hypothetical protein PHACADRAFT_152064 [Phanerochaete carnosa HHB-10118-sp]
MDFLTALFADGLLGKNFHQVVLECVPDNDKGNAITFEKAFANAYVYFTHFAIFGHKNILDTCIGLASIICNMAIQCWKNQKAVNLTLPVAMPDGPLEESVMSYILVQIKGRSMLGPLLFEINVEELRTFPPTNNHPFIAITMHLSVKPNADKGLTQSTNSMAVRSKVTNEDSIVSCLLLYTGIRTVKHNVNPHYSIHVHGCSEHVYGVIQPGEKDAYASIFAK